jgi:hypothetical protein
MAQLDFFVEYSETELIAMDFEELRKSQDKLRKALFARHGELAKRYCELHSRMEIIERNICRGFALNG